MERKVINREDIVEGDVVYYLVGRHSYLLNMDQFKNRYNALIHLDYDIFTISSGIVFSYPFYKSTTEEAFWMRRCIKEGKFVPRNQIQQINNSYSIF